MTAQLTILPGLRDTAKVKAVDEFTHWPGNARIGNVQAIADSLEVNGQYKPLILQASSGHVIVGNHTLKAARELGWPELAYVDHDVDDDRARAIALVDNRTGDLATWDDALLAAELQKLPALDGSGFGQDDLQALLETVQSAGAASGPDAPDQFGTIDPDALEVEYTCPQCAYSWRGNPN